MGDKEVRELLAQLKKPFPLSEIKWRAGAVNSSKDRAMALAYIEARATMDRLDEVIGPQNWQDVYQVGPGGGVICGISISFTTNDGSYWVTKWDGAENTDFEAIKGGLSDAFKRAGVKWGIGRYLYSLPNVWVKCQMRGKYCNLIETPELPGWAIPDGDKSKSVMQEAPPESEKTYPHTQDGLVAYAESLEVPSNLVGVALGEGGFTGDDLKNVGSKFDDMCAAIEKYAKEHSLTGDPGK